MNKPFFYFNYERPEDGGAGGADPAPEATPDPTPSFAPTQEEWNEVRDQIKGLTGLVPTVTQISQVFEQLNREPESTQDDEDFDIGEYIHSQIQQGLAPIMPIITSAAQKSGQERQTELFKKHEQEFGKFDHELAGRAAQAFFNETGDPVKSVEQGAKYAAEYRKAERDAAVAEYKESLKRPGPQDPSVEGGGDRAIQPAKSYDEVVERWAGQTEV